jgi:hypothetical protein
MLNNIASAGDSAKASVELGGAAVNGVYGGGVFTIQCFDKDGNLKWEDKSHNLVVNVGLADMNTKYFTGASYTAAWYLGLITGPASGTTISAGDTLASHGATGSGGWTENTDYSGNRKAVTFGSASTADPSVINNTASPAAFSMTGTATIAGAFLASVATGTSGVLFSASDFQAPGDRAVVNGDTLNVTYQFSLDAA